MGINISMFIRHWPPFGAGAEHQALLLSRTLARRGHRVRVFATSDSPAAESPQEGLETTLWPKIDGKWGSLSYVVRAWESWRPEKRRKEVLHVHGMDSPFYTATLLAARYGLPVIAKLRGRSDLNPAVGGPPWKISLLRRYCHRAICVSKEMYQDLLALQFPEERAAKIPNGVDTEYFTPVSAANRAEIRDAFGMQQSEHVVLCVGRLSRQKGVDALLSRWPEIRRKLPSARLIFIGRGSLEDRIQGRHADGVKLVRWTDSKEIRRYYQCADCLVHPSESEGMSNVLLEAMSSGLPVVATRVGGSADLVQHEETGIEISVHDDANTLAGAVLTLADNPDMALALGANAREYIVENYGIGKVAERYERIYDALPAL